MYPYQEGSFEEIYTANTSGIDAGNEEILDSPHTEELSLLLDLVASGHEQSVPNGKATVSSYELPRYSSPDHEANTSLLPRIFPHGCISISSGSDDHVRETNTPMLRWISPDEPDSRSSSFDGHGEYSLVISCGSTDTPSHDTFVFPSKLYPDTSAVRPSSRFAIGGALPQPDILQPQLVPPMAAFHLEETQPILHRRLACDVVGCNRKERKLCVVDGCMSKAYVMGLCRGHGGASRCSVQGCNRGSQGSRLCRTHGGGKLCVHPGCKKGVQRNRRCSTHGAAMPKAATASNVVEVAAANTKCPIRNDVHAN